MHEPYKHHILFVTLRADFGGGPEHLWQLLKGMPSTMDFFVACPKDYPYFERYKEIVGEQNVCILPHRKFSVKYFLTLLQFHKKKNITCIHSHGKGAGVYARLLALLTGTACVHTFHGVHIATYGYVKRKIYCFYEHFFALFTKKGIAVSQGEYDVLVKEGLFPQKKLAIITNGVAVPEKTLELLNTLPHKVVSFTRFDAAKNTKFVLYLATELKKRGLLRFFTFILVGEGEGKRDLEKEVQNQGFLENIVFVGASVTPHEYFTSALCYLSTSLWEGMPLAVLEAMGHGLPVVVSDVVGNKDVVKDGETGLLFPFDAPEKAVQCLCLLAENSDLCKGFAEKSRAEIIQNFSVERMRERTYAVYTSF